MLTNSCVKLQTVHTIPMTMNKEGEFDKIMPSFSNECAFSCSDGLHPSPDDESSGLYGFLNVIVHSASGLKQSLSKFPSCFSPESPTAVVLGGGGAPSGSPPDSSVALQLSAR